MSRRGSYTARMIARNVGQHCRPVETPPSCADLASTIYDVEYRYVGGNVRSFPVLALSRSHAAILAELRLLDTGAVVTPATTITPRRETSRAGIDTVRAIESEAEREDRQARYASADDRIVTE